MNLILNMKWCWKAHANGQKTPASVPSLHAPSPSSPKAATFTSFIALSESLNHMLICPSPASSSGHIIVRLLIVLVGSPQPLLLWPPRVLIPGSFCLIPLQSFHCYCQQVLLNHEPGMRTSAFLFLCNFFAFCVFEGSNCLVFVPFFYLSLYLTLPVPASSFIKCLSRHFSMWLNCWFHFSSPESFPLEPFVLLLCDGCSLGLLHSCCPDTCVHQHTRTSLIPPSVHLLAGNRILEFTEAPTVRVEIISHYRDLRGRVGFSSSSLQFPRLRVPALLASSSDSVAEALLYLKARINKYPKKE